jgi:hypothetical protein
LDWLREYDRLAAEIRRKGKQTASLERLVAALRACLDSGAPTDTEENRSLLRDVLSVCTPDEREEAAQMLAGILPKWMQQSFRDAAAAGGN